MQKNLHNYGLKRFLIQVLFIIMSFFVIQAQNNYIPFDENQGSQNKNITLPQRVVNDNGTENVEIEYTFAGATVTFRNVNNIEYSFLHIDGFGKMGIPGQPAIPMHNDLVIIPENADAEIIILETEYIEYSGYMIHPALEPALDVEGAPEPPFKIDEAVYNNNQFYPANIVQIAEKQKIRGLDIAITQIRPVQFNPVTQTIIVYSKIKYSIIFNGVNKSFDSFGNHNSEHFAETYRRTLLNGTNLPSGVKAFDPDDPSKNYIIITHDNYLDAADSLAKWKQQLGYGVEIITGSNWTTVDIASAISMRYYSSIPRPDFFVILGDHQDVPAVMVKNSYPTDLYYACMDGSADYFPDMAHGRISVSSASEAMDVILKIINYERYPVIDPGFYSTALVCAQFQDDDTNGYADRRFTHTAEDVRNYLISKSYDVNRIYYTASNAYPTNFNDGYYSNGEPLPPELLKPGFKWDGGPQAIINSIDSGKFVVLHRDHGYVGGSGWAHPYFTKTYIDNLQNGNKTPVVFSINCHTGEFSLPECFVEKFLRKTPGGAVGVFAASYASYSGYNDGLTAGFFDAIWSDPGLIPDFGSGGISNPGVSQHPPIITMGDVLNHGLLRMMQTWDGSGNGNRYQHELFHFFGDPAMKIFTAAPIAISADHADTITAGSSFITIANSNCPDAIATAFYKGQLIGKTKLMNGAGTIFFKPVSDTLNDLNVTLSKHNYIPYSARVIISSTGYPANDEPCNAVQLPVNLVCDPLLFSNFNATGSTLVPAPSCGNYSGHDIWFYAMVPQQGAMIIETNPAGGITHGGMEVFAGSCSNLLVLQCDDGSGTGGMPLIYADSLNPGDTLYIRFWNDPSSVKGEFSICVYEPGMGPFATLPYYTGFENGLDQFWDTMSSNAFGRIRIDTAYYPHSGNYHLLMDVSVSNNFCLNSAILRLNLAGEKNVQLRFWFKKFNDENHYEDGLFFSNDGGANYEKIYTLEGGYPEWTQFLINLDELTAIAGLNFSETSLLKFQQYDNWPIDSDGFAFDDIYIFAFDTSICRATIPYETGFENGMDSCWITSTSNQYGRNRITPSYTTNSGVNALAMDVVTNNNHSINHSQLHLDLSGHNNVLLTYWIKEYGDEDNQEDGIYFSDNRGISFTKVLNLYGNYPNWTKTYLSVSGLAAKYGLQLNDKFVINFVQYDNWGITSDGFLFDDIRVDTSSLYAIAVVQPDSLFFSTDTNTIQIQYVNVKNIGSDTLKVHIAQLPGSYSAIPSIFDLAAGDSITVSISFAPTLLRNYNGLALFFSNTIKGIDTVAITGRGTQPPKLVRDRKSIDFGLVPITTSVYESFELENIGSGPLNVIDIDPPLDFHINGDTAFTMPEFSTRTLTVKFSPKTPGPYQDTLYIYSDINDLWVALKGLALNVFSLPEEEQDLITIFPNPATDKLYIEIPHNASSISELRIYNMMGEMIRLYDHQSSYGNVISVDVSVLTPGTYFVEVMFDDRLIVKRFAVIR